MKMLTEASKGLSQLELRDIARSELESLRNATGLASALYIREGDYVVCIEKIEGTSQIRIASHVGKWFHMHSSCTGKAIMAHLPEEEVDKIIHSVGLPKMTANTITSVSLLKEELARVKTLGFAVDDQEYGVGIKGIAAPIFDLKCETPAAISSSGAVFEFGRDMKEAILAVKRAAFEISKKLGYSESVVVNVYRHDVLELSTTRSD